MDRQRSPIAAPKLLQSLELTAIDEDAMAIDLQKIFGSGNRPRRAEKRQGSHKETTSLLLSAKNPTSAIAEARSRQTKTQLHANRRAVVENRRQEPRVLHESRGPPQRRNLTDVVGVVLSQADQHAFDVESGAECRVM